MASAHTFSLLREAFTVGTMRFRSLGKSDREFGSKSQSVSCLGRGGWVWLPVGKLSALPQSLMSLAFSVEKTERLLLFLQDNPPWLSSDTVALFLGCTIFENCKSCRNGSWGGTLDDFYIKGIYCAECRAGWYGGDCMSKCPTQAGRDVGGREWWDRARAMLCLSSYSCTETLAKGTSRRRQTQLGSKQTYSQEKNSSPSTCLRGIVLALMSWWVRTLPNVCLGLVYFKTLTTVTPEIFCHLHFLDMLHYSPGV